MSSHLFIKGMVCPRCIEAVENILKDLNIKAKSVVLGKAKVEKLKENKIKEIEDCLKQKGFELLLDRDQIIVEKIKTLIVDLIHHAKNVAKLNSKYLSKQIGVNYIKLSKLFKKYESITIEQFIIQHRIEKAKELLSYGEISNKEIAFTLGYSSVQYFNNQFKQITGLTVGQFKKLPNYQRKPLDQF